MIETNELRIGNWVFDEEFKEPITISHVDYIMDGFTPIPLNGKILEMKTVVKFADLFALVREKDGNYVLIHNFFQPIVIDWYMTKYIKSTFKESEIRYVHQLQNLYFALTGKELEIEL